MDEKTSGSSSGSEIFLVCESIIWFCRTLWKKGEAARTFSWAAKILCSWPTTRVTIAEMEPLKQDHVSIVCMLEGCTTADGNLPQGRLRRTRI
jgi:hypothetical protein